VTARPESHVQRLAGDDEANTAAPRRARGGRGGGGLRTRRDHGCPGSAAIHAKDHVHHHDVHHPTARHAHGVVAVQRRPAVRHSRRPAGLRASDGRPSVSRWRAIRGGPRRPHRVARHRPGGPGCRALTTWPTSSARSRRRCSTLRHRAVRPRASSAATGHLRDRDGQRAVRPAPSPERAGCDHQGLKQFAAACEKNSPLCSPTSGRSPSPATWTGCARRSGSG